MLRSRGCVGSSQGAGWKNVRSWCFLMVHFSLWTAAWWWAHSVMALSVLVGPPLNHSVMWWIWQYTAGMVQPGAWQPRSRARMARRWVGVKNRRSEERRVGKEGGE